MSNMAGEKRKYVLFNKSDGRPDSLKPCAFFASAKGCRNGTSCAFSHSATDSLPTIPDSGSSVVSNKNNVIHQNAVEIQASKANEYEDDTKSKQKKAKKRSSIDGDNSDNKTVPHSSLDAANGNNIDDIQAQLKLQQRNFELELKKQQEMFKMQQDALQQQLVQQQQHQLRAQQLKVDKEQKILAEKRLLEEKQKLEKQKLVTLEKNKELQKQKLLEQQEQQKMLQQKQMLELQQQHQEQLQLLRQQQTQMNSNSLGKSPQQSLKSTSSKFNNAAVTNNDDDNNDDDNDDGDDEEFLFSAVNVALVAGQKNGNNSNSPGGSPTELKNNHMSNRVRSNSGTVIDFNNPFVSSDSVMKILQTSGTKHATLGPTAHVNVKSTTTTTTNKLTNKSPSTVKVPPVVSKTTLPIKVISKSTSNPPPGLTAPLVNKQSTPSKTISPTLKLVPVASSLPTIGVSKDSLTSNTLITGLSTLPWSGMVLETKQHSLFNVDYSFQCDYTWVKTKPYQEWVKADSSRYYTMYSDGINYTPTL